MTCIYIDILTYRQIYVCIHIHIPIHLLTRYPTRFVTWPFAGSSRGLGETHTFAIVTSLFELTGYVSLCQHSFLAQIMQRRLNNQESGRVHSIRVKLFEPIGVRSRGRAVHPEASSTAYVQYGACCVSTTGHQALALFVAT